MSEGAALLMLLVVPPIAIVGPMVLLALREGRAIARRESEALRSIEGLPPHPKCSCATCAKWRAANAEKLRGDS